MAQLVLVGLALAERMMSEPQMDAIAIDEIAEPTPVPRVMASSTPRPEMLPRPWTSAALATRTGRLSSRRSFCPSAKLFHPLPKLGAV